jgi:hypothetical protein
VTCAVFGTSDIDSKPSPAQRNAVAPCALSYVSFLSMRLQAGGDERDRSSVSRAILSVPCGPSCRWKRRVMSRGREFVALSIEFARQRGGEWLRVFQIRRTDVDRRRHQPRSPPLAKITPGRPAPTTGPLRLDDRVTEPTTKIHLVQACPRAHTRQRMGDVDCRP